MRKIKATVIGDVDTEVLSDSRGENEAFVSAKQIEGALQEEFGWMKSSGFNAESIEVTITDEEE